MLSVTFLTDIMSLIVAFLIGILRVVTLYAECHNAEYH
jgi:hypothetical protein